MAAALAEHGLHIGAEGCERVVRHERQQRPGKAAAVNAAGAAPGQLLFAGSQREGHLLVFPAAGGDDVLQQHPRRVSGLAHTCEEALKIARLQRLHLPLHPAVFVKEVHRAQNGAVARGLAGCLEICVKLRFVHLAQHVSAEYAGHAAHFRGDGGVFVRQIRVVRAGVERAERVAAVREVKRRLPDDGVRRIGKVDEDQPADARGHLVPCRNCSIISPVRLMRE